MKFKKLSFKQEKFRDNLLSKLGFRNGELLYYYCRFLEDKINEFNLKKDFSFIEKSTGKQISGITDYTIVDRLYQEVQFRINNISKLKTLDNSLKITTATDLANFSFCPVSYSISNTFDIPSNLKMKEGANEHEFQHLINWKAKIEIADFESTTSYYSDLSFINEDTKYFFREIKNSTLIYSGHQNEEKRLFYNKKRDFVGQPDYIFQNLSGKKFVVEEKFRFTEGNDIFHKNHKIQLLSYLYGINEYELNFGYLIYWDKVEGFLSCKVIKIIKGESDRDNLNEIFCNIKKLKNGQKLAFEISQINIKKCINCSYNIWCGHKTGRYNEIELPYSKKFLRIFNSQNT